jgi:hypothetical protein
MEKIPGEIVGIIVGMLGEKDMRMLVMTSKGMMKILVKSPPNFPQMLKGFSIRFAKNRCLVCREQLVCFPVHRFCIKCMIIIGCNKCNRIPDFKQTLHRIYFPLFGCHGAYCIECRTKMTDIIRCNCGQSYNFYGFRKKKYKCVAYKCSARLKVKN